MVQIRSFLLIHSRYDYGLISHAIVGCIKVIIKEFDILLAQLEHLLIHNKLSLQKCIYLLQPSKTTLSNIISPLIKRLHNCAGGQLIDVLYTALNQQGDSKAREVIIHILNQASIPFLTMLSQWLFR